MQSFFAKYAKTLHLDGNADETGLPRQNAGSGGFFYYLFSGDVIYAGKSYIYGSTINGWTINRNDGDITLPKIVPLIVLFLVIIIISDGARQKWYLVLPLLMFVFLAMPT